VHQTIVEVLKYVDTKLAEAQQAVKDLTRVRDILTGGSSGENESGPTIPNPPPKLTTRKRAPKGSIRDKVLACFRRDFLAVRDVAQETGLDNRQVRGVLTAPDLKASFQRREVDGLTHYKYIEKAQ
jgi:hypothetical protein